MIREAKHGNVQAGRLVLEHSGKLVKNVNVTIDSPFEKFLKKTDDIQDAEIVEDEEVLGLVQELPTNTDLPPRNKESQRKRVYKEKKLINKAVKDEVKRQEYNKKQKEWYNWRKRAKTVGIEPLKGRRPTAGQRKEWQNKIIAAEKSNDS
jgi:Skp family chaperone for outer membrane proteins